MLIGSKEAGAQLGRKPRARMRAFANIGSEPAIMLTGPVDVTRKLLARARMQISDIDLFEVNEAFASVVLRYLQAFDLDPDKVNVNGGAIALGHPLGATGAMILGTALDELERLGKQHGADHAVHRRRHGHRHHDRARVRGARCRRSTSARWPFGGAARGYPPPHDKLRSPAARKQAARRRTAGLTQFGVNLTTLKSPASASRRLRHVAREPQD